MDRVLGRMLFAPDCCRHRPALSADADNVVLVSSRTLDRCDIKSKSVTVLMCTLDMNGSTAVVASHAGTTLRLAGFAHLLVPSAGNRRDALARLECLCVSKFDLGGKDGAGDMNPVFVCRLLQRLSRVDRSAEVFLPFPVELSCLHGHLLFLSLSLAFLLCLFLMRDLGRLHEVMNGGLDRTEDTLVVLKMSVSVGTTSGSTAIDLPVSFEDSCH